MKKIILSPYPSFNAPSLPKTERSSQGIKNPAHPILPLRISQQTPNCSKQFAENRKPLRSFATPEATSPEGVVETTKRNPSGADEDFSTSRENVYAGGRRRETKKPKTRNEKRHVLGCGLGRVMTGEVSKRDFPKIRSGKGGVVW